MRVTISLLAKVDDRESAVLMEAMIMKGTLNAILTIGIITIFTVGSQLIVNLYGAYWGDRDIWWTPRQKLVKIEDTSKNFEIYVKGKMLQKHLDERTLFVLDSDKNETNVTEADVGIRVNNWQSRQVAYLSNALWSAFGTGAAVVCLIEGLRKFIAKRKKKYFE